MTELHELGAYKASLEEHAARVLGPGVHVEVRGMPRGAYRGRSPTAALSNAFAHHRILDPVLDYAVGAERQGYDAFIVGSFSEPFLRELRSAVDIPVVSVTEATLLVACSIGRMAAPISNDPGIAQLVAQSIESHGLQARVRAPVAIDPPLDEYQLAGAFADPSLLLRAFQAAARRAIDGGADTIIPAEGVLSEFLHGQGVAMIDEVPVMDCFGVAWSYAAMMAGLRKATGLAVSRRRHYRRDDAKLIAELLRDD